MEMDTITNESLIADFASDLIARNLSATTIRQYPLYVRIFADFFDRSLLDADENSLSSYFTHLRSKKLEQSSIKRYFTAISTFYEFAIWKRHMTQNPVLPVRKHYLKNYKSHDTAQRRQCISVDQAKSLVRSILDPEEKAIIVLFLKTGMRLGELVSLDVGDVDMDEMTIRLHPTGKRSNEIVYFDYETARVLARWLRQGDGAKTKALFIGRSGHRLSPDAIERIVTQHAVANELHDPSCNRHQLQSP
jgi:site-specific recombinase XerD